MVGTRASLPEGSDASRPGTFLAGVYRCPGEPESVPELVAGPDWLRLRVTVEGAALRLDHGQVLDHRRWLDMRRGQVIRLWRHRDRAGRVTRLRIVHWVSLADRQTLLQRIELTAENYTGRVEFEAIVSGENVPGSASQQPGSGSDHPPTLVLRPDGSAITLAFASATFLREVSDSARLEPIEQPRIIGHRWVWEAQFGRTYHLDKLVTLATSRVEREPAAAALARFRTLRARGSDDAAHRRAWQRRWGLADVEIVGDPELQRASRFAAYHLLAAASPRDERVSIGARGLTGAAYKGHVFWDTEIFMLPFFLLTWPRAARSLLMYRYHTLSAAREKARRLGYRGALYAWESADTGEETTPERVTSPAGEVVPIQTGFLEHHISADVAFAVWQYWRATRDAVFLRSAGAEIILETARFWASRVTAGPDGRHHIRRVIGPDEYHEAVDDNAYTNGFARWNLRRGLEVASLVADRWPDRWSALRESLGLTPAELAQWRAIADTLADGLDPNSGLIAQFAGYDTLEEVALPAGDRRALPMDIFLGRERVQRTKVLKQADVILLLYLLWDAFPRPVHEVNFRYYEPRTAHGSSLSPGIHAAVAARLGDLDLAQRYLRQTAAIDLGDQMGNAAGGVHLAALGSLWQAMVCGFAGLELLDDRLAFQPRLLPEWGAMRFAIEWRGRTLRVSFGADPPVTEIALEAGRGLLVAIGGGPPRLLSEHDRLRIDRLSERWEVREPEPG
jgi:kojibiose phosphorylase